MKNTMLFSLLFSLSALGLNADTYRPNYDLPQSSENYPSGQYPSGYQTQKYDPSRSWQSHDSYPSAQGSYGQSQGSYGTNQRYYNQQPNFYNQQKQEAFSPSQGAYYQSTPNTYPQQSSQGGYQQQGYSPSQKPYGQSGSYNPSQGSYDSARGYLGLSRDYTEHPASSQTNGHRANANTRHHANHEDHFHHHANDTLSYTEKYPKDTYSTPSDLGINNRIRKHFSGWFFDSYKHIILHTSNGVVTIEGYVENDKDLAKLADEIRKISGVTAVRNNAQFKR